MLRPRAICSASALGCPVDAGAAACAAGAISRPIPLLHSGLRQNNTQPVVGQPQAASVPARTLALVDNMRADWIRQSHGTGVVQTSPLQTTYAPVALFQAIHAGSAASRPSPGVYVDVRSP